MILYSNGCSYTCNLLVSEQQRYQNILADRLKWSLKSAALPGSCNRRIIRCTIRDCIQLLKTNKSIFCLVQLSHLTRIEYAGQRDSWRYADQDLFESLNGIDHPDNTALTNQLIKSNFLLHNEHAELTRVMSDLIGLIGFFKQHNIEYLIYTGPRILVDPKDISDDVFYQYLQKDQGVLDLVNFNMLDLIGEQKHPDVDGMQIIADYFFSLLCESA